MEPTYLDKITKQRQEKADAVVADSRTSSIVDAIKQGNSDLGSAVHNILLASVIGKDPQIAEVAVNLAELLKELGEAKDKVSSVEFESVGKKFDKLADSLASVPDLIAKTQSIDKLVPYLEQFEKTLKSKDFNPSIQVSQDFSDLQALLKDIKKILSTPKITAKTLDLSTYRAHDLYEEEDTSVQYVGYINPEGGWYIISYDLKENTMRYKFGKDNYKAAWGNKEGQEYRLLNEAVDGA